MYGEIEQGVSSMKEFTALRTLELDVGVFAGPPIHSEQKRGIDSEGCPWITESIPALADILPPTVEIVTLYIDSEREEESLETLGRLFVDAPFAMTANAPLITVRCCGEAGETSDHNNITVENAKEISEKLAARRRAVNEVGAVV